MSNGNSDRKFVPAFISPRVVPDEPPQCRWGLVGTHECSYPAEVNYRDHIILCKFHKGHIAESSGYVHRSEVKRRAEGLAETEVRMARFKVRQKDETIAHLRTWLQEERTRPEPQPAKKKAPVDGTVYFLRVGGYIKIGWTSNLEKRMRGYQPDTILLATKPGTRKDERALHRKFAHLKTHGREWFPLAPQIMEEVERTVKDHGAPPAVDFSARKAQRIVGPRLNKYVGGDNRGPLHSRQRFTG